VAIGAAILKSNSFRCSSKLESEGIKDSLAQHTCSEPLRYLENFDAGQRAIAQEYLGASAILMATSASSAYSRKITWCPYRQNLARHLTGFTPDFSANIDIEAILKDLLNTLHWRQLASRNSDLTRWAKLLPAILGIWLLVQERHSRTSPISVKFSKNCPAKFHPNPSLVIGISATARESYLKLSSRLAPKDSTYNEPVSSLSWCWIIYWIQKEDTPDWKEFRSHWDSTLLSEARLLSSTGLNLQWRVGPLTSSIAICQGCFPPSPYCLSTMQLGLYPRPDCNPVHQGYVKTLFKLNR